MRYFNIILLSLIFITAYTQDVEITASASPNVLRVGEQFNLTFSSNQEFDGLEMPDIRDFQLLGGPSQGSYQSVSVVNGKMTSVSTWQYTYFLRAVKEGKFIIPEASIKIKNKVYRSNPVMVEVLKASDQQSSQGSAAAGGDKTQAGQPGENEIFVRLILDKREVYMGEQITASVKIYSKTNRISIDPNFKGPEFTGFFTEPIETPPLRNLQREAVDGDIFLTGVLRRFVIIPQKEGELTIGPFNLDIAVRQEVRRRIADPFFEDFVIPDIREIPVKLKSRPVKITVRPLPSNAPASFRGAVGNFRLSSSLNKTETTVNEPLTLKIAVSGKGNIKLINEIPVDFPYDMEHFDPVINSRMDNALSGTKTFEYLLMPKVAGRFTIPPAEFAYFDTDAGQYKTLRSESYDILVRKGAGDSLVAIVPGVTKEDVRLLSQDIRFIKTSTSRLNQINRFIAVSPWYYALYVLVLALFLLFIRMRKRIIREHADITGMRLRKADKYARKRLKKSESLLKQGNSAAFYEEMLGAVWGYLSHKLSIPVSSLSKDTARTALESRSVDGEVADQLFNVIDTCEMARYGYGTGETDKHRLYHDAVKVITSLQQKLK